MRFLRRYLMMASILLMIPTIFTGTVFFKSQVFYRGLQSNSLIHHGPGVFTQTQSVGNHFLVFGTLTIISLFAFVALGFRNRLS